VLILDGLTGPDETSVEERIGFEQLDLYLLAKFSPGPIYSAFMEPKDTGRLPTSACLPVRDRKY